MHDNHSALRNSKHALQVHGGLSRCVRLTNPHMNGQGSIAGCKLSKRRHAVDHSDALLLSTISCSASTWRQYSSSLGSGFTATGATGTLARRRLAARPLEPAPSAGDVAAAPAVRAARLPCCSCGALAGALRLRVAAGCFFCGVLLVEGPAAAPAAASSASDSASTLLTSSLLSSLLLCCCRCRRRLGENVTSAAGGCAALLGARLAVAGCSSFPVLAWRFAALGCCAGFALAALVDGPDGCSAASFAADLLR